MRLRLPSRAPALASASGAKAGGKAGAKDTPEKGGGAASGDKKNPLQGEIDDLKKYRKSLEETMKQKLKDASKLFLIRPS